ncbi:GcrA family cell cycle regulator [Ochrobactrum sp. 3-3]|uniref:GcrA family cell cycle regulator n=1 Tax=Ochrobactrum sp. 3-3 TaxID=1830124 RepID=UPI000DEF37C8|nr:GcrA family cell cycle regulator [Ochrobactrum sp. 3-3]
MTFWYEGHLDQIAQMLRDGLSARQIAAKFDGVSRNAVIGLVGRRADLAEIGFSRSPRGGEDRAHKVARLRREKAPRPEKPKKEAVAVEEAAEVVRPDIAASLYDANSLRVELHNIPVGGCHWPVNDVPKGGVFLFCGCEALPEKPYCEVHYSRSIGKGTESERAAITAAKSITRAAA